MRTFSVEVSTTHKQGVIQGMQGDMQPPQAYDSISNLPIIYIIEYLRSFYKY